MAFKIKHGQEIIRWNFLEDFDTVVQMYQENLPRKGIKGSFISSTWT